MTLGSITGLSASDYEIRTSQNGAYDGVYVDNAVIHERYIDMNFQISSFKNSVATRNMLLGFFSPKHKYTLFIERNGVSRRIGAEVASFKIDPESEYDYYVGDISLMCPDPYFSDAADITKKFLQYAPMLTFPTISPRGAGAISGIQTVSETFTIDNEGDAEFGVLVKIECYGGIMEHPKISCNDSFVSLPRLTLNPGDALIIDTRDYPSIKLNGADYLIYDPRSVFFTLKTGRSTLNIQADSGVRNARTEITYANRYLGV